MKYLLILIVSISLNSCNSQENEISQEVNRESNKEKEDIQIAEYVVNVFEDSNGNLWFGTLSKGVARYDGKSLKYFTQADGLPSNRVTGIIEDSEGVLWFGTGDGLSRYDGERFINFSKKAGLGNASISDLLIDSKGGFWIGTWGEVFTFNGKTFSPFVLPEVMVETPINNDTKGWVTDIAEDTEGNIWFARDNYGSCRFDGTSFTHMLKKDGLHSNNVTEIEFDKKGAIWFGTRVAERDNPDPEKRTGRGGVNVLFNNKMESFPEIEGFNDGDVYEIYKAKSGVMWISTVKNGIYKYDGQVFDHFDVPISIMSMSEGKNGNLWLGGAGGPLQKKRRVRMPIEMLKSNNLMSVGTME